MEAGLARLRASCGGRHPLGQERMGSWPRCMCILVGAGRHGFQGQVVGQDLVSWGQNWFQGTRAPGTEKRQGDKHVQAHTDGKQMGMEVWTLRR